MPSPTRPTPLRQDPKHPLEFTLWLPHRRAFLLYLGIGLRAFRFANSARTQGDDATRCIQHQGPPKGPEETRDPQLKAQTLRCETSNEAAWLLAFGLPVTLERTPAPSLKPKTGARLGPSWLGAGLKATVCKT